MPAFPQFTASPIIGKGSLSTAETDLAGTPGDNITLVTAGINGTRIDEVVVNGATAGLQAAKVIRLWIVLDSGPTWTLLYEIALAAVTQSATVAGQHASVSFSNLVLPSGYSLRATTSVTEATTVHALGGAY